MDQGEKLDWFPFYWLKFLVAVNKWKPAEVGAYTLLLIHQWDNGFIPESESEIEEITGISFQKLSKVMRKFEKVGNRLFNKRLEIIRSEQLEKNATNSNRGKKGAEVRWREHKEKHAQALPEQSLTNSIRIEENRTEKKRKEENREEVVHDILPYPTFGDFWDAYEKKIEPKTCERLWSKISQADREKIMEHIPKYIEAQPDKKYRKNPETYLRNESWNDEIIKSNDTGNNTHARKSDRLTDSLTELAKLHRDA